jgi:hypothetical protein
MPYLAGIAGILLMGLCIMHAVKTGRTQPWLFIIIFLPGIGSLVYFISEILPDLWHGRDGRALRKHVKNIADPDADLRAAKREAEMVGSADSKKSLAEELYRRGNYAPAIDLYRSALSGIHKDDPALWFGLARAQFAAGDGAGAQASLDALQAANPEFGSDEAHLLYARALEMQGGDDEAAKEYEKVIRYFSGEEARCRYGLFLKRCGYASHARDIFNQILRSADGAPRHYIKMQREWIDIARANTAPNQSRPT